MSLKETKEHLLKLLLDTDNKVIALSGEWGTEKTHLWGEVVKASEDEAVKKALYVSLFGLSGIDQLKSKLIESFALKNPNTLEVAKQMVKPALKALESYSKALAALGELKILLMAPVMLRGRIIVIDDIERKHDKLEIDEILGFIDEYTKRHESRFILVLNSDQLAKREVWEKFREKVIDQELMLRTRPEEAFEIAVNLSPSRYAESIKRASVICRLTNIRIIGKVIKATNQIIGDRDLEDALLDRLVPSIVLFAAIHYKGIKDGPDFQFALSMSYLREWGEIFQDKNKVPTAEDARHAKWGLLMKELGIHGCDEFEVLVVEFLESGLFDASRITPIIERYVAEKQSMEAYKKAKDFLFTVIWDHRLSDAQLLELASGLPAISGLLDPYLCTELAAALAVIPEGALIGKNIIDGWIAAFKSKGDAKFIDENSYDRPLHEAIAAEFQENNLKVQAKTGIVDACMHIIEQNDWGVVQVLAMKRASVADFESVIRGIDVDKLPRFMRGMMGLCLQRQNYDQYFGAATEHFLGACKKIANEPASGRLAALIKNIFANTPLASEIGLSKKQADCVPDHVASVGAVSGS